MGYTDIEMTNSRDLRSWIEMRWIARTTSKDFVHWTEPVDLELGGQVREHLYTNQFNSYVRALHIYLSRLARQTDRRIFTRGLPGNDWRPD